MSDISVFIEGDLDGFRSANAKQKFKNLVRTKVKEQSELSSLGDQYIKEGYQMTFVSNENNKVRFNLTKKEVPTNDLDSKRQMLRAKLNMMRNNRTNVEYQRAKNDENVSSDILNAYMTAKKVCKIPIPEPREILAHPEEHKQLIQMVLSNPVFSNNSNHPYIRYFKLLGDKLGVEPVLPIPTRDYSEPQIQNVLGNEMNKDADTDDEN